MLAREEDGGLGKIRREGARERVSGSDPAPHSGVSQRPFSPLLRHTFLSGHLIWPSAILVVAVALQLDLSQGFQIDALRLRLEMEQLQQFLTPLPIGLAALAAAQINGADQPLQQILFEEKMC